MKNFTYLPKNLEFEFIDELELIDESCEEETKEEPKKVRSTNEQYGDALEKKWRQYFKEILKTRNLGYFSEKRTLRINQWKKKDKITEYDSLCFLKETISKESLIGDCIEVIDRLPNNLEPGLLLLETKATVFMKENSKNPKINVQTLNDLRKTITNAFWPLFCIEFVSEIWTKKQIQVEVPIYLLMIVNGKDPQIYDEAVKDIKEHLDLDWETFLDDFNKNWNYWSKFFGEKHNKAFQSFLQNLKSRFYFGLFCCSYQQVIDKVDKSKDNEKEEVVKEKEKVVKEKEQVIKEKVMVEEKMEKVVKEKVMVEEKMAKYKKLLQENGISVDEE